MKLIPHTSTFVSAKNGTIMLHEFLWWKILFAGGFEQSGPYVVGLWSEALAQVRHASSILIIGLGLGDNVRITQKRFPKAQIVVIEWDPMIIQIAREAKRFEVRNVTIREGDLREILPTLTHSYDLILSDAFFGDKPEVGIGTSVGESFARILAPGGTLMLNASRTPAAIEYLSHYVPLKKSWKFKDNTVALFRM